MWAGEDASELAAHMGSPPRHAADWMLGAGDVQRTIDASLQYALGWEYQWASAD
jgi:hypothetical protein